MEIELYWSDYPNNIVNKSIGLEKKKHSSILLLKKQIPTNYNYLGKMHESIDTKINGYTSTSNEIEVAYPHNKL